MNCKAILKMRITPPRLKTNTSEHPWTQVIVEYIIWSAVHHIMRCWLSPGCFAVGWISVKPKKIRTRITNDCARLFFNFCVSYHALYIDSEARRQPGWLQKAWIWLLWEVSIIWVVFDNRRPQADFQGRSCQYKLDSCAESSGIIAWSTPKCVTPQQIWEYVARGFGVDFFETASSFNGASDSLEEEDDEDSEASGSSLGGGVETPSNGCGVPKPNQWKSIMPSLEYCSIVSTLGSVRAGCLDVEVQKAAILEVSPLVGGLEVVVPGRHHPCCTISRNLLQKCDDGPVEVFPPPSVSGLAEPTSWEELLYKSEW